MARPRVGVSACLLGDTVRYDGGHKYAAPVAELGAVFELVRVCPEVELGLPVPRPPIELVQIGDEIRLRRVDGAADLSEAMQAWARARIAELRAERLAAFVLKRGSPSCGLSVPVRGGAPSPGYFVRALRAAWPELVVQDESALDDPTQLSAFISAVKTSFAAAPG